MRRSVQYGCGLLLIFFLVQVNAAQAYLYKFQNYLKWSEKLPSTADPDFFSFIEFPSPLTTKLREKWLYQMAYSKRWSEVHAAYRGSKDVNLQCYAQTALYNLGHHQAALLGAVPLWLRGSSQPKACDALFRLLLAEHAFTPTQLNRRLTLALKQNNIGLAKYVLQQLELPKQAELIAKIHQEPIRINQLTPSKLHGKFYLYGLKLLVARNLPIALTLAEKSMWQNQLTNAQKQDFTAHVALYKAMRHQSDALTWVNKVKQLHDYPRLLDWAIRSALSEKRWAEAVKFIQISPDVNTPCWRYWRARAQQALGDEINSNKEYKLLAETRNYYGFLASRRIHHPLSFEEEQVVLRPDLLKIYQPILEEISKLYNSHQTLSAARRLNDFMSELPADEQSAIAEWVARDLHWYDRAIYLSNTPTLNNTLSLRFPLAYQTIVSVYAQKNQIKPELILAMIRQESTFRQDIVSPAGAQGIMQIMPLTARVLAKQAGIAYTNQAELLSPEKNIELGAVYLKALAKQFNNHPILMAAAYNAGPKQVRRWMNNEHTNDIDLWIETLPWKETRNYLKNILAFYAVYQHLLHQPINLDVFMLGF